MIEITEFNVILQRKGKLHSGLNWVGIELGFLKHCTEETTVVGTCTT